MSKDFSFSGYPRRAPRRADSSYEHVLDGDQWQLRPGVDFGGIASFRARLSRMCQDRGLRYRSLVHEGTLWVEAFRERPGDLLPELDGTPSNWPGEGSTAASAVPPEPSPGL